MQPRMYLGTILTVDENCNLKIPLDKLETCGIKPNSKVEVFSSGQELTIKTIEKHCDVCGRNANPIQVGSMNLCPTCKEKLEINLAQYEKTKSEE